MAIQLDREDLTGLAGATEQLLDCMASADSVEDVESCEIAYDAAYADEQVKHTVADEDPPLASEDRAKLWGANQELLDCIADANGGDGIEACELAYDATYKEVDGNKL